MEEDQFAEEKDRNFITALARGLEVLRCFRQNEVELSNTDISERTGLPKATVSRLTYTLRKLDYLVADSRTGTYRLSAGVLQLGFGVLAALDIADRAESEMKALRDGPNSYITVALGERHRNEVIYLAVQTSREDVSLTMRVGARLPLFFSAIGRAILAGMDEDRLEEAFDDARRSEPDREAERLQSYDQARREFGEQRFCTGYGDWRPDVNGIAVPVTSLSGNRLFGLNVGGPSFHVKRKQLETVYAQRLIRAGQTLSLSGEVSRNVAE